MQSTHPEWFTLTEILTAQTLERIGDAVGNNKMGIQVMHSPLLAYWFMKDSLYLASEVNRDGMHANALALTRQCMEALGVIELGICGKEGAEDALVKWNSDKLTPGNLRAWLQNNVWHTYGSGLWAESWSDFMSELSKSIQPYAHYGRSLAQWQTRICSVSNEINEDGTHTAVMELAHRGYDSQKATRITLFHAILIYILGRIWIAANADDTEFETLIKKMGQALSRSEYLDGHSTDWGQQFWAMLWRNNGSPTLE